MLNYLNIRYPSTDFRIIQCKHKELKSLTLIPKVKENIIINEVQGRIAKQHHQSFCNNTIVYDE